MGYPIGFGTVLGYHTVAELKDLTAAKDVAVRNLSKRYAQVQNQPGFDLKQFLPSYQRLVERYVVARQKAQQAIDTAVTSFRPLNLISAESEWNDLLFALNPRWKEYTWSSGDGSLEDLYDQVIKAGSTGETDEPTPQPQSGSDADFNVLTTTNQITHSIESAFDTKHLILYGVLGGILALFVLPRLMAMGMGIGPGMVLKR